MPELAGIRWHRIVARPYDRLRTAVRRKDSCLHASRNAANSRVKDLVDLALLIGSGGLDKQRIRIPDGAYWYDNRSGAAGRWGGPGIAILQPGLDPGGPMPANCS